MRWLPFIFLFLLAYIEISIFIAVADVLGIGITLLLIIATSFLGASLVRSQGMKNFRQMQQKMQMGENPAAEMIKSVSLLIAGFLLIIPGFFTDFLAVLLLLPIMQKLLLLKILPHLRVYSASASSSNTSTTNGKGETIEGEFSRKHDDDNDKRLS